MKVFLILAVLSLPALSKASNRDIFDVMYLPSAGTTFGISDAAYLNRKQTGKSGNMDTDISALGINQTVGHSFSDRFSVSASLNYIDATIDPDVGSDVEVRGISDPTFLSRFRLMEEGDLRLDLIGGALLSLGDSEIKSSGNTDNRQGGHGLLVGAQVGQKKENFQWSILGQLTHNLERTYDFPFGNADIDSNNDLFIRADILNKLGEKSFLRSFAAVDFRGSLESDDTTPQTINASSTDYELGTEYQYLCSKDFLARVGVDYGDNNSNSGDLKSDRPWTFRVGATYQF